MKFVTTTILSICLFISLSALALAEEKSYVLKVVIKAGDVQIDSAAFPPDIRANFLILNQHCTDCHGQDRIVEVLKTGLSRTGSPYGEKNFHEKVMHILRTPGVRMTRDEAIKLTKLFTFMTKQVGIN